MKTINIKINWETEDEQPIPQEVIDKVSQRIRLWLHEKGMEGELTNTEDNGKKIASIRIMKPEDWINEDIKTFSGELMEFVKSMTMAGNDE